MAYRIAYSDYSTTATGPPDPERWVGPPGPPGPTGPVGPQGPQGIAGNPFPEAPNDGPIYGRGGATVAWVPTAAPSTTPPVMDGTAAVGASALYARQDHIHPTDTSRYAASNPSGYQTAGQVTTSLGAYLPLAGGTITGPLVMPNLPTSNAGLAPGTLWNNGGFVCVA